MSRPYDPYSSPNPKRFYRSRTDKVISGVCAGLAERYDWDVTLVRVIAAFLLLFVAGPLIFVAYLVVAMITPYAPAG